MDFEAVWNRLVAKNRWELTTARGEALVALVAERSIRFESPNDQPRSVSKERFRTWFHSWFDAGRTNSGDFRNETGQQSKAGNIRHVKQLFELIGRWDAEVNSDVADRESAAIAFDSEGTARDKWNHDSVYEALVNRGERQNLKSDPRELYGTRFLPDYPQGRLKLGRFRGTKITGDILDNKQDYLVDQRAGIQARQIGQRLAEHLVGEIFQTTHTQTFYLSRQLAGKRRLAQGCRAAATLGPGAARSGLFTPTGFRRAGSTP